MSRTKSRSALAAAIALLPAVVLAPPAEAFTTREICWKKWTNPYVPDVVCTCSVEVEWIFDPFPDPGVCPQCGIAFDWAYRPEISVSRRDVFGDRVVNGLALLGASARAGTPAWRAELRAAATQSFVDASTAGVSTRLVTLQSVGWADAAHDTCTRRAAPCRGWPPWARTWSTG
ncbi:hypothetical protein AB0I60_01755 [Actinosynnema sp. NPDC050436]|uniref:hypothetical protein n=1 Tax=Actinosynnema sp. NPDC050436 TaxID=3155659 RepID=UPI0033E83954